MSKELVPVDSTSSVAHSRPSYWSEDLDGALASKLAKSSIDMYRRDVAAYEEFATSYGLDSMRPTTLEAWRDYLTVSSRLSPNTINRMLSAVKRIVKQAAKKGVFDADTALQFKTIEGVSVMALKGRLKQNSRTRITPEDMRRIAEKPDVSTLSGLRDKAVLATLASSGVRATELATLTPEQIVSRDGHYFLEVKGKTDIVYRDAYLSAEAYGLIRTWLDARKSYVEAHGLEDSVHVFTGFGGRGNRAPTLHLSETGLWFIVKKYADECGLSHIKPHDFRRFLGTQLAKKDIRKAQLALGHKSIEVTARHYVLDRLEGGETDKLY